MNEPERAESPGRDRFAAVPASLRENQKAIADAGARWEELSRWVVQQRLGENDLGLLGRMSGVTAAYNQALERIASTYRAGAQDFGRLGASLDEVADRFEEQDESYYRAFGYLDRTIDRIPEPPR